MILRGECNEPLIRRLSRLVTSFWRDGGGMILPYVAIMLTVIVGMAALALDGGRFMSLQTQMQAAADFTVRSPVPVNSISARRPVSRHSRDGQYVAGQHQHAVRDGHNSTFAYTYAFYQSIPAAHLGLHRHRPNRQPGSERFGHEVRCRDSYPGDNTNHSSDKIF